MNREEAGKAWGDMVAKYGSPSRVNFQKEPDTCKAWYGAGIIPMEKLEHGKYYYGNARNAAVAMWDGIRSLFIYRRTKFGSTFNETILPMERDNGFDLFFPIAEATDYAGAGEDVKA